MHKKVITHQMILIGIIIISIGFTTNVFSAQRTCGAYAEGCGDAAVYTMTMNKLEVSTSTDGTNSITVVDTPQTWDIASATAGATVGSWFSGANLGPGDYVWMRRTMSTAQTGQGYVVDGADIYYTSSSPDNVATCTNCDSITSTEAAFTASPPADYAAVSFTIALPGGVDPPTGMVFSGNQIIETDTSETFPIDIGKTTTMDIQFNVENTIELLLSGPTYSIILSEPNVGMEVTQQ